MSLLSLYDVLIMSSLCYKIEKMISDIDKLDTLVLKQAVRDVASKDVEKSNQAILYFKSEDFANLCSRLGINSKGIVKSVLALIDYPVISRKKISNDIAREIDKSLLSK